MTIRFNGKRIKVVTRLGRIQRGIVTEEDEFFITLLDERDGQIHVINKHEIGELTILDDENLDDKKKSEEQP